MNIALLSYFLCFFLILWSCQWYIIYLSFNKKNNKGAPGPEKDFSFSIIVPTCNEEELIAQKIDNLRCLSYKKKEVIFADSSQDRTAQIISQGIGGIPGFRLIKCLQKNRSSQINEALALTDADLVMITDCDGEIPGDALEKACRYFGDGSLGVLGAWVLPKSEYFLDLAFWKAQNALRFLESGCGHSSTVSGVCYIFRRSILKKFPDSVWSDDIYVTFLANTEGYRSLYSPDIKAFELRSPASFSGFWEHKIRKAQDNIKETARFLPETKRMSWVWRLLFLTRAIQISALPFLLIAFILLFLFQSAFVMIFSLLFLIFSLAAQILILKKLKTETDARISLFCAIGLFLLTNSIVLTAVIKYMFNKGRFSYSKVT